MQETGRAGKKEDLVGATRNFKRKNGVLKAEVEFLRCGTTDWLFIVGKHVYPQGSLIKRDRQAQELCPSSFNQGQRFTGEGVT